MEAKFTPDEKELIRLTAFFRKQAEQMKAENKLDEAYVQLLETCDKLIGQMHIHAGHRESIRQEQEELKKLVHDNARCPKCEKSSHLKAAGTDTSAEGWVSNKYKCRRCNIEFVWNAPNNLPDMIPYIERMVSQLEQKAGMYNPGSAEQQFNEEALAQMKANLAKIKPVIDASRINLADLEEKEKMMADLVTKVKKQLLIEKIRMS